MQLTVREQERLLVSLAAMVARDRRERGLRLNHPEAVAILASFVLEGARDGRTVADLMDAGRRVLGREDVMDGIPEMLCRYDEDVRARTVDVEIRRGATGRPARNSTTHTPCAPDSPGSIACGDPG